MSSQVCVDASFVIKLVVDEENSAKARAVWTKWLDANYMIMAPCHLAFETISVLRQLVHRGVLSAAAGQTSLTAFLAQEIHLLHPQEMHERAWQLAIRFNRPTVYDTYYVALGELYGCELWTADKRLYKAVQPDLSWVKLLDFYQPEK